MFITLYSKNSMMQAEMPIAVERMELMGNSLLGGKVIWMVDEEHQRAVTLHITPEELEALVKIYETECHTVIEVEQ